MVDNLIKKWQSRFKIKDWQITTERIKPEQIEYNGEDYFVGIVRDFKNKKGIIYHDIDLDELEYLEEIYK